MDNNKKNKKQNISPRLLLESGKLPPQAIDLEEAVLGAMLQSAETLGNIIDILNKPEVFYKEAHQRIFQAIKALFDRNEPVDILTVTQELKKTGELDMCGGAYYITQLTNKISSGANSEKHSRIVLEKYMQRELIHISTETLKEAYGEGSDVFDLLENAEQNLFSISNTFIKKNYEPVRIVAGKTLAEIEQIRNNKASGVMSGFKSLDAITGGWQKSDLIILAARPSVGKSSLAVQWARNAAVDYGVPVGIFSLEMSSIQLMMRSFASEAEIPSEKIRQGQLDENEFQLLHSKIGPLISAPLFIDDTPGLSLFEFRSKARRLKAQHDIQLLVIDYLQLMTIDKSAFGRNREQEVREISGTLKTIAKELNIPIIALSQLSREPEKRAEKKGRPQLSDLRESGSIEQDADIVMFIYRAEKHGYLQDEEGNDLRGVAEIIIAKHRNGKTGDQNLYFNEALTRFEDRSDSFSIINPTKDPVSANESFLSENQNIAPLPKSDPLLGLGGDGFNDEEDDVWYNK